MSVHPAGGSASASTSASTEPAGTTRAPTRRATEPMHPTSVAMRCAPCNRASHGKPDWVPFSVGHDADRRVGEQLVQLGGRHVAVVDRDAPRPMALELAQRGRDATLADGAERALPALRPVALERGTQDTGALVRSEAPDGHDRPLGAKRAGRRLPRALLALRRGMLSHQDRRVEVRGRELVTVHVHAAHCVDRASGHVVLHTVEASARGGRRRARSPRSCTHCGSGRRTCALRTDSPRRTRRG